MKAVILSGGSGVRLSPLTSTTTKQLLPVANRPTLFHVLDLIKTETSIKEICVVVSEDYGSLVKETLLNSEHTKYFDFDFVFQDKPLGLAHAVQITSMHMGDDPFLMFLGDVLISKGELKAAYEQFTKNGPETLVIVNEVEDPRPYGIAEVDNGYVTKLVEKPQNPKSNLCLSGIYFFNPNIFYAIANIKPSFRGELEITDAIDFQIQKKKKVEYYAIKNWWYDVGTPENMLKANKVLLSTLKEEISSKLNNSIKVTGKVHIEENVELKNCELIGPIKISKNCKIKNSTIGPNVSLGENISIMGTTIENSIIRDNAKISAPGNILSKCLIGRSVELNLTNQSNENSKNAKVQYIFGDNTKCKSL